MSSLLSALQIYDGINPPYNSTVFFELHQVKGNYFVTITYNGEETVRKEWVPPELYNPVAIFLVTF